MKEQTANRNIALVTGASGGIGLELARIHARNGHDLVLVARRQDKLDELKQSLEREHGIFIRVMGKDLALEEAPAEIYAQLKADGIEPDFLINNAGIGDYGIFHESSWKKQAAMIDLNVKSLTHLTRLFAADMVKRGSGRIMNVASTASFQAGPLMSVYYATKHYVLAFSEALAQELSGYGVSVTALCPGPTHSDFHERADMKNSRLLSVIPFSTSRRVAEYGYRAMMRGKRVAVHGMLNKVLVQAVRFAPRRLTASVVRKIQESR